MSENKKRFYRNKIRLQALLKEYGNIEKVAEYCGVGLNTIRKYGKEFGLIKPRERKPQSKPKRKRKKRTYYEPFFEIRKKEKVIYAYIPKLDIKYDYKVREPSDFDYPLVGLIHPLEIQESDIIYSNFKSEMINRLIRLKKALGYELEIEIGFNREKWSNRDYYYEYGFSRKGKINTKEFKDKNNYRNLMVNDYESNDYNNILKIDDIDRLRINFKRVNLPMIIAKWLSHINQNFERFELVYFHTRDEQKKLYWKLYTESNTDEGQLNLMLKHITKDALPESIKEFLRERAKIFGLAGFRIFKFKQDLQPIFVQGWIWSKSYVDNWQEKEMRECIDCGKKIFSYDWQTRCLDCYLKHTSLN